MDNNFEEKYGMPREEAMDMFHNCCEEYSILYPFYAILYELYWKD